MATHLFEHGNEADAAISGLRQLAEPLNTKKLSKIVTCHGRFCALVSRIARDGRELVSFASKYLHFHAPVVPIYDSWAYGQAWRMRNREGLAALSHSFPCPSSASTSFYWYCLCFWQLYSELLSRTDDVNVRLAECYLMWLAHS